MTRTRLPDGMVVEVERDLIDCTPMSVPDLNWRHVDASGHEHRWRATTAPSADLPTLRLIVDREGGEWFDEDGFENYAPAETHYECVECGDVVPNPAFRSNDTKYYTVGLTRFYINGQRATQAEIDALKQKWTSA